MKAPRFAYARPASIAEALALLQKHGDDARVLAGGQSLVPMMNFRVAAPKVLVDINRIGSLTGIKVTKSFVRIGALARHVEVERSADVAKHLPLVAAGVWLRRLSARPRHRSEEHTSELQSPMYL